MPRCIAARHSTFRGLVPLVVATTMAAACAGGRSGSAIPPTAPRQTTTPAAPPRYADADFTDEQLARITPVQPLVGRNAREHGLDPDLINGVIWVESRFQPRAKSPAGARGLMQLMPATAAALAKQMGTRGRSYDPKFNVAAGSLYLAKLLERFDGDETLALAAYNAGAGNVAKYLERGGLPEYSVRYVESVLDARARFAALRRGPEPAPTDTMLAKVETPAAAPEAPPPHAEVVEPEPVVAVADTSPRPFTPPDPSVDPPLADTPYPPREEESVVAGVDGVGESGTAEVVAEDGGDGLPSVLDEG